MIAITTIEVEAGSMEEAIVAIHDNVIGPELAAEVGVVGVSETADGWAATIAGDAFLISDIEAQIGGGTFQ